jgi:hypothetical protein
MDQLNLHLNFLKYVILNFIYFSFFFHNFDKIIYYDKVESIHKVNLLIVVLLNYDLQIKNLMDLQLILKVNLIINVNQINKDVIKLSLLLFFSLDQILVIFLINQLPTNQQKQIFLKNLFHFFYF